ncbi:MAG: hypothetical protein HZC51_06815 [Nitrospirae bacterium]|nr:hypothetical protein [Nitrospirota bacterium]
MKRFTKALVMAAVIALPLAAADFAAADDRPRYGGPGFGINVGFCQGGACVNNCDICRDRAQARADFRELRRDRARGADWREVRADRMRLRADMRELRSDMRDVRHDRMGRGHGYGHGHGYGWRDNCGNGYGRR